MARHLIGYGWSIELPEGFEERASEGLDGTQRTFYSAASGRTVYAVVYQTGGGAAEAALAELARERGTRPTQRFDRRDGTLSGEAWLMPETREDGTEYWGLNTFTSQGNCVACVTIYFDDPADVHWARGIWATVRPESGARAQTVA